MKLGVAISGCGIGAVTAHLIPALLGRIGLVPDCMSCSSVATLPMGFMGLGHPSDQLTKELIPYADALHGNRGKKLERISMAGAVPKTAVPYPVLLCAADVITAQPVVFAMGAEALPETYACTAGRFSKVLPGMLGMTYGLPPQSWNGRLLCDFSLYFGSPLFPLKRLGAERILLVHFENESKKEPVVVCADRMARQNASMANAVLHIPDVQPGRGAAFLQRAECALQEAFEREQQNLLEKLVF